ncbi:MAG: hypothetical protein V1911_02180 [Candidatus Micrarchaeota archaeon]
MTKGFTNVYKKPRLDAKRDVSETKKGYELLEKNGIPVAKYKGITNIRHKDRMVFEKCSKIKPEELRKRLDEAVKIIVNAAEKGVSADIKLHNLGINKEGKLVLTDTNVVWKFEGKHNDLLENYNLLDSMFSSFFTSVVEEGRFGLLTDGRTKEEVDGIIQRSRTFLNERMAEERNKIKDRELQQAEQRIEDKYFEKLREAYEARSSTAKKRQEVTERELLLFEEKQRELEKAKEEARKRMERKSK